VSALAPTELKRRRFSPTIGRGMVLDADVADWHRRHPRAPVDPRSAAWLGEWVPNALLDEGEQDLLNVYYLQTSDLSKYLALMISTAPAETDTMAILATKEVFAPPLNGYARVQILNTDWGAPALNSGDYQTTAAQKTFGPSATTAWTSLTGVTLVTAATGQASGSGKLLTYVALSGTTTVNISQSFLYQLAQKAA
jgi:hypothetical protein